MSSTQMAIGNLWTFIAFKVIYLLKIFLHTPQPMLKIQTRKIISHPYLMSSVWDHYGRRSYVYSVQCVYIWTLYKWCVCCLHHYLLFVIRSFYFLCFIEHRANPWASIYRFFIIIICFDGRRCSWCKCVIFSICVDPYVSFCTNNANLQEKCNFKLI